MVNVMIKTTKIEENILFEGKSILKCEQPDVVKICLEIPVWMAREIFYQEEEFLKNKYETEISVISKTIKKGKRIKNKVVLEIEPIKEIV